MKYKYPKNTIEKLYENIFNNNIYIFIGTAILIIFITGFSYVVLSYDDENTPLSYKIDIDNRLQKPFWLEEQIVTENKISNKLDNSIEDNKEKEVQQNITSTLTDEASSSDEDFLFEDNIQSNFENKSETLGDNNELPQRDLKNSKNKRLTKLFIFGTNSEGRDIFTNLFLGLEIYFIGGLIALLVALIVGILLGSLMAYNDLPKISWFAKYLDDIISSFPKIIILFIILIVFDIGFYPIMIGIGVLSSTKISKALSEKIKYLKNSEFIDSAKQIGLSDLNILIRHILYYNCRDIFIVYSIYILADVILLETTLAYLNFGIEWNELFTGITLKSWGTYLSEGKSYMSNGAYWITLFPALFIILLILSLNFIGDGLKEKFHIN